MDECTEPTNTEFKPYPVDALPETIRSYVMEVSKSIGCDPSFIALPMFSCLASAIGSTRVIRCTDTWTEPSIIWSGIIGESGTMKSPAITEAVSPLQKIQRDLKSTFDRDHTQWKSEFTKFEAEQKR